MGFLGEKNEEFKGSIEGTKKILEQAKSDVFKALFKADDLKGFNEGLSGVLNITTKNIKTLGGLPGILLTVGAMFSGKLIPMFRNGFNSVV
jgi:hypothetical protein